MNLSIGFLVLSLTQQKASESPMRFGRCGIILKRGVKSIPRLLNLAGRFIRAGESHPIIRGARINRHSAMQICDYLAGVGIIQVPLAIESELVPVFSVARLKLR